MKKDYIPVSVDASLVDETAFVEQYWTEMWKDRTGPPEPAGVVRGEEHRVIQPYLAQLRSGTRILDGGCGMGEWTVFLARRGFDVVGLDLSESVIQRLKIWFPALQFVRGDIRRTGFPSGSFDAYLSWGTFEHFEDGLRDCLQEAHRVLQPGGWLFVSVPFDNWRLIVGEARSLDRWDSTFDRKAGYHRAQRFYQWRLTRPELQRELELHGFRVHAIKPIGKLTGAGRMLHWDVRMFRPGSRAYRVARRALALMMPASFIAHMILAISQRR